MSKIKSLLSTYSGRIYVYLADGETGKRFLRDAEDEGFTFADGIKPTEREPDGIFAVNDDMTINYVGFIVHMAYRVADRIGNQPLIKLTVGIFRNRRSEKTAGMTAPPHRRTVLKSLI